MRIVLLNVALYTILLLWYRKKCISIDACQIIIIFYLVVAVFCLINYWQQPQLWNLHLWSFIYLFSCLIILLLPFRNRNLKLSSNPIGEGQLLFYKRLSYIYIVLSFVCCAFYLPIAIENIVSGGWSDVYENSHDKSGTSVIMKIINFCFHLRYIGITLSFSFLSYYKKFNRLVGALFILSISPILLVSVSSASRGGVIFAFTYFVILYSIFSNIIPIKSKKTIKVIGGTLIMLALIYIFAVTASRFQYGLYKYSNDTSGSIVYYLGHSMLVFSDGITDSISKYAGGDFMFNLHLFPQYDANSINSYFGTHFASQFFTIVGALYLDFGPYSLVVSLSFSYLIAKLTKNNDIPSLFVLVFYSLFLIQGAFVQGRGYGLQIIETIVLYEFLHVAQGRQRASAKCVGANKKMS